MSGRFFAGCLSLVAIVSLSPSAANGQTTTKAKPAAASQARTPWGDPDIQGIWNNVTATPLQRSEEFKDKAVLTSEEAENVARRTAERQAANEAKPIEEQSAGARTGYSATVWFETTNKLSDNRTSLLLFP